MRARSITGQEHPGLGALQARRVPESRLDRNHPQHTGTPAAAPVMLMARGARVRVGVPGRQGMGPHGPRGRGGGEGRACGRSTAVSDWLEEPFPLPQGPRERERGAAPHAVTFAPSYGVPGWCPQCRRPPAGQWRMPPAISVRGGPTVDIVPIHQDFFVNPPSLCSFKKSLPEPLVSASHSLLRGRVLSSLGLCCHSGFAPHLSSASRPAQGTCRFLTGLSSRIHLHAGCSFSFGGPSLPFYLVCIQLSFPFYLFIYF